MVAPSAGAWIEIFFCRFPVNPDPIAPSAGAWIEMICTHCSTHRRSVAPSAGAWIEMYGMANIHIGAGSLPPRERGLKFSYRRSRFSISRVAPSAGAWIEMQDRSYCPPLWLVAPSAGAWIEI